ncbi:hypothetical protein V1524DRAFT_426179 [Lipomyces starkeyi]
MPPPPTPTSARDSSLSRLLSLASFIPPSTVAHPPASLHPPRQQRAPIQTILPWTLTFTMKEFPHIPDDVEAREVLARGLEPYGHLSSMTPVPSPHGTSANTGTFEIEVLLRDSRTIPPSCLRLWEPVRRIDADERRTQGRRYFYVKLGPPRRGVVRSYCVYCHATDHLRADCVKAGSCAHCGKMGHFVGTCPGMLNLRTPRRRTRRFYDTAAGVDDGT